MEPLQGQTAGTPMPESVSTKLQRIAQLAREAPQRALLSLAHYIDIEFLHEAFRRTRKEAAPGVDGQSGAEYAEHLEENLQGLLDRFKSGRYHAPPVRRAYVPKGDGTTLRPIGVPTFEDKVLQRAVAMVLEAICEQDFLDCSYGFRLGRSAHQALQALWQELMQRGGGWVVEVDIRQFFDTVDHRQLRRFLDQRVRDGVIRRTLDKWLKAGVLDGPTLSHPEQGTPQGSGVSPLLANLYLHEVLDKWFATVVKPRLTGRACLIRYADDAVLVFACEEDARRVLAVLPKRFGKYGLTLHPEKTRLLRCAPPLEGATGAERRGREAAHSFAFLGLTHYWEQSRQGQWVVKRKTAADRFGRVVKRIARWCRLNRHQPVPWQHQHLSHQLRGHDAYYGITGNGDALRRLRYEVARAWQKWLNRRSHRAAMSWERFQVLLSRYPLPTPILYHSVYRHVAKPCR